MMKDEFPWDKPELANAIIRHDAAIETITAQRDALLAACRAMLEPFGRNKDGDCSLCGFPEHTSLCPIPITEAAIKLCESAATPSSGESL